MRLSTLAKVFAIFSLISLVFTGCWPADKAVLEPQITLPSLFVDELVTSLSMPTAFAFTPDGRLLITTKAGQLRVYTDRLLSTSALDLSSNICSGYERGLLGIAVDPEFASNNFIYLFYSHNRFNNCQDNKTTSAVGRVSRFTLASNNTVSLSSEVVLIDQIPAPAGNHNGGDLNFGKDGYLYITTGDGGCHYAALNKCTEFNDVSRQNYNLAGKILRIKKDGTIPSDNPYQGSGTLRCNTTGRTTTSNTCQEIYAKGLRNPFRMAFDPNASTTRFFINDVGRTAWEEINLGQAGVDYGWNLREGNCVVNSTTNCGSVAGVTNPIFSYPHTVQAAPSPFQSCKAITGGAFVPSGVWPTEFNGNYLFGEYTCGKIIQLIPSGNAYTTKNFATGFGVDSVVHMRFGPYKNTQALYYTNFTGGGQIRRIRYTGVVNQAPVASFKTSLRFGNLPLTVGFDASSSTDPESQTLNYAWDFGDGNKATGKTVQHIYTTAGPFTARLTVQDNQSLVSTMSLKMFPGNMPPVPVITSPSIESKFGVAESITLTSDATDIEDGVIPENKLYWRVDIRHDEHTHPYLGITYGKTLTLQMPAPEGLDAVSNSYLEVYLTAVDSQGLSRRIKRIIYPQLIDLSFITEPTGLQLEVNAAAFTAPKTIKSWKGYSIMIQAKNQTMGFQQAAFVSWSDGRTAKHNIAAKANKTYTATFSLE